MSDRNGDADVETPVATGGDPQTAVAAVLIQWELETGGRYQATVAHDDGCPCVAADRPLGACTCEIVYLSRRRLA